MGFHGFRFDSKSDRVESLEMTVVAASQAHVLVYSGFRRLCTQKKKAERFLKK